MPTRRNVMLGLGGLLGLPAAAAAMGLRPAAAAVAYDLPGPIPPPPSPPKRIVLPETRPRVYIRADPCSGHGTEVLLPDGRKLWGVCSVQLYLGKNTPDRCTITMHGYSVTGAGIAKRSIKYAHWGVDVIDGKPTLLDEDSKEVEGVSIIGWECDASRLAEWTVFTYCTVEWTAPDWFGHVNYPHEA